MRLINRFSEDVTDQVIQYLEDLATMKVEPQSSTGICSNIALTFDGAVHNGLFLLFEEMGYHGDWRVYPVAGETEYYSSEGSRWDWGERGYRRRAFCSQIAQWLRDHQ